MEIERKFVPEKIPEEAVLKNCPRIRMTQAYLCTSPVVRVRQENSEYVLTYKGTGLMVHEEYNMPLTAEAFSHLLQKCDGMILRKDRYCLPVEGYPELTAELDLFGGRLSGLVILEVEFPTVEAANAFVPPAWFGKDVTEDPAYHNSSLSRGMDPRKKK